MTNGLIQHITTEKSVSIQWANTVESYYSTYQYNAICTTIHRYPIFSMRYFVLCKVYIGYRGTCEIEHGLCACTVDNPLTKALGLSLRTGTQTMLYLSCNAIMSGFPLRRWNIWQINVTVHLPHIPLKLSLNR